MSQKNELFGHPRGLSLLFFTEMWERFSYYGMRAILTLYMTKALLFDKSLSSAIYGDYTGLVYLTPLIGGFVADNFWGNRKSIVVGGVLMAIGQFFMFLSASNYQTPGLATPGMGLFDHLCAWSEAITRRVAWVGLAFLACAMLVTVLDILTRRSIGWSVPGLVDITQLLVMSFVYLSIPFAFTREANVSVEFATDILSPRALALVKATGALAATGFMVALAWYCLLRAQLQMQNGDASQTIGIPFVWNWIPLIIGFALGIGASLLQTLRHARFGVFGAGSADSEQSVQI